MSSARLKQQTAMSSEAWHCQSAEAVAQKLSAHMDRGLSPEVAKQRLAELGPNELRETPRPPFWRLVLEQFESFLVMLLIIASVISALLANYVEAAALMTVVLLNAIRGVVVESKAENALAAFKKMVAPNATVVRDGTLLTLPSSELVLGDIVVLEAGHYVPADVRLVESLNLRIEEAALTGESVPVEKSAQEILKADVPLGDRRNTAFMGTLPTYGRGRGIVVATGMHTELGLISETLQTLENEPTPLQQRLDQLGRRLGYGALTVCALVFAVAVFNQTNMGLVVAPDGGFLAYLRQYSTVITELFKIAVSLAIAAVPEGLPGVVTITLAIGMRQMLKQHVLIRRLAAVETLGSASVICSDKTGTLTQNQMTAVKLWVDERIFRVTGEGYSPRGGFAQNGQPVDMIHYPGALTVLWAAALSSDAYLEEVSGASKETQTYRVVGDPTEGALVVVAAKAGMHKSELESAYLRVCEIPLDSERKRMSIVLNVVAPEQSDASFFREDSCIPGKLYVTACKGAPDVIMPICTHYQRVTGEAVPFTEDFRSNIFAANEAMEREGLRVLAVSYRVADAPPKEATPEAVEHSLVFLGLFGIIDPARPEVIQAIEKARRAGIRTIMITGDYPDTAGAIGQSIGLLEPGHRVLSGAALDKLNDRELLDALEVTDAFAWVNPADKVRIVEGLKQRGEVVAMTGDGVNDAPALKRADIGVAMGVTGTEVAKGTADIVLTDDNFASIVAAVEQGRIIYANIRKLSFFLISSNVAEIMIIFLPTVFGLPIPLTAIQLLWLNMVSDGAPALALTREKGDPDVMERPPRLKTEPIIYGSMRLGIVIQAITQAGATLAALLLGLIWHLQVTNSLPGDTNPLFFLFRYNWSGVDVQTAETMAFVTLSLSELFRAFTCRSERLSFMQIGPFANPYLLKAVLVSILMLLAIVFVPFLNPIFNTNPLRLTEWEVAIGLALIPAASEEITKWYLRRKG